MPSLHPAWRIIGLLLAVVFLGLAVGGIVRGRFDDHHRLYHCRAPAMVGARAFRATEERQWRTPPFSSPKSTSVEHGAK
jgi:hypothetical protein